VYLHYTISFVIKSFRHKGLEQFFTSGTKSGIRPDHAKKLQRQLAVLDNARSISDLPLSWKPHQLSGVGPTGKGFSGHHAIWLSGNWRLTFEFQDGNVHLLDYLDYH
jgi:proteic killer suppression protein